MFVCACVELPLCLRVDGHGVGIYMYIGCVCQNRIAVCGDSHMAGMQESKSDCCGHLWNLVASWYIPGWC